MKTLPKISIIIPIIQGGKTLETAIKSILDQQYEAIEIIILETQSTDAISDVVKRYENYISYWYNKRDFDTSHFFNEGIKKTTGDFVTFLLSTDWYEPNTFHTIANAHLDKPYVDIISCGSRQVYYDPINKTFSPKTIYSTSEQLELSFYTLCFTTTPIGCRFIKRELFEKIGLFLYPHKNDISLLCNEKEFLLRAAMNRATYYSVKHIGHNHFDHPGSSPSNDHSHLLHLCQEHMIIADSYLNQKKLTREQRTLLKYWYMRESIRILFHSVLNKRIHHGFRAVIRGIKKFKLLWIFTLLKITSREVFSRVKQR